MVERDEMSLPVQEDDSVRAIARLHAAHAAEASAPQLWIERLTRRAGTPAFLVFLSILTLSWIALNIALPAAGYEPLDAAPFPWLQGALALASLYIVILILTTQLRDDKLSALRDQLTLEIAILGEQKSAKVIALLEELRRDAPGIADRADDHAHKLSKPTDASKVLDALKDDQARQGA